MDHHQLDELGEKSLFDGGDLSLIATKRPEDFYGRWLDDPKSVNSDHRMPVFKLDELPRADLLLFLQSLGKAATENFSKAAKPDRDVLERGNKLIAEHRCAACHELPMELKSEVNRTTVDKKSDWEKGCLAMSDWSWRATRAARSRHSGDEMGRPCGNRQ